MTIEFTVLQVLRQVWEYVEQLFKQFVAWLTTRVTEQFANLLLKGFGL